MATRRSPREVSSSPRLRPRVASVPSCGRNVRHSRARSKVLAKTMHLASQHLVHRCHTKCMHFGHPASEFLREVTATQMNVQHGGLDIPMPSKSRNLVNVPVGSRQIGQTQM